MVVGIFGFVFGTLERRGEERCGAFYFEGGRGLGCSWIYGFVVERIFGLVYDGLGWIGMIEEG